MSDNSNPRRPPAVYALPERAHLELVELREHMRLMGRLAEPVTAASDHDHTLHPHALAWMCKRIGRDIGRVLKATYWSADVQERVSR